MMKFNFSSCCTFVQRVLRWLVRFLRPGIKTPGYIRRDGRPGPEGHKSRRRRSLIWNLALHDIIYDITSSMILRNIIWYWCLWYHKTMISYAYDIIPDYVWYQRTYDIIDLWYHRQYHRSWTMILCMISSSWIYDITTLNVWYQRTYDSIGLWYHKQYHRFWTMISCMIPSS